MPSLWKERKKLRETKDMFNRVIDIIVTGVLGAIVLYVWIIFGTNLTSIGKNINSSSLPSNINQAPYCCKGKKSAGSWKYGLPYNLGDNPTIIPFIPCAVNMISFEWLRTLLYVKPWISGTLKQSWSIGRGMVEGMGNYIPTGTKVMTGGGKGGGKVGDAWNYVKGKGSNTANYLKSKGSSVFDYVKSKGTTTNWNFTELLFFVFSPFIAILTIILALPTSILITYFGSFKTSLFWSIFGFLFVFILAAINSIVQVAQLTGFFFLKGMKLASFSEVNKNFFKYGRGPFVMGLLLLILKTFPEIPFYLRIILCIITPALLFLIR